MHLLPHPYLYHYCTTPIVRPSGRKLSYSYTHERRGCGEDHEVDVCVTHPTSSNRLLLLLLPNLEASHPNRTRLFQVAHLVRRCQGLTRSLSTLRHATFSTFARFTRYSSSRSDKSCYFICTIHWPSFSDMFSQGSICATPPFHVHQGQPCLRMHQLAKGSAGPGAKKELASRSEIS